MWIKRFGAASDGTCPVAMFSAPDHNLYQVQTCADADTYGPIFKACNATQEIGSATIEPWDVVDNFEGNWLREQLLCNGTASPAFVSCIHQGFVAQDKHIGANENKLAGWVLGVVFGSITAVLALAGLGAFVAGKMRRRPQALNTPSLPAPAPSPALRTAITATSSRDAPPPYDASTHELQDLAPMSKA